MGRITYFQAFLILLAVGFLALTVSLKLYPIFSLDLPITKLVQSFHPAWFNNLMELLTFLGNEIPGVITLGIVVGLLLLLRKTKDAGIIILSTLGATLIGVLFKTLVARPRPDASLITQVGHFAKADSFPSGHVLFFMGLYGFLLFFVFTNLKKGLLRNFLSGLLIVLLILIGLSRVYLGAHWFSDVLGSYLIGTIWLYFVVYLYKRIR